MPKRKHSAVIRVADGAGGMQAVVDHRFEVGSWPVELTIPATRAAIWMAHLKAETQERGWSSTGISQVDADENSGSVSIHTGSGSSRPVLHIVWEKPRGGDLCVKARPGDNPTMSADLARDFISAASERLRKGVTTRAHRWAMLTYQGLPWRGELWLDNDVRLGPPSRFPDALIGPQVVIVDAIVGGIGTSGITATFETLTLELRIFLNVVLAINAKSERLQYAWVPDFDEDGRPLTCELQSVGYVEVGPPRTFPKNGSCPPVAREAVARPGIGRTGVWPDQKERWVPEDIEDLWQALKKLSGAKRDNFLRAGNALLIAHSMWPDQRTAYVVFLVVACEALKPRGNRYKNMNIYDVVASLIGPHEARKLRQLSMKPQTVRSNHVHSGELAAGELLSSALANDEFADSSFNEMVSELSKVSRMCLIQWLRCRGKYKIARLPRPRS